MSSRVRWAATAAVLSLAVALAPQAARASAKSQSAQPQSAITVNLSPGEHALVRFRLPDKNALDRLTASGADLAAVPHHSPDQVLADVVVDDSELAAMIKNGATPVQLIERQSQAAARANASKLAVGSDTLQFLQDYWWTSNGKTFLQTQVATTATDDPDVQITVTWKTADGATGSYQLVRFEDDGEYQYHWQVPQPLPGKPVQVTATSSLGGATRAMTPSAWPGATPPAQPAGYQKDFV
ncbi:peptidase M14, partial [Actinoplanes sp. NPDC051411]